jgi:hypothetical protein
MKRAPSVGDEARYTGAWLRSTYSRAPGGNGWASVVAVSTFTGGGLPDPLSVVTLRWANGAERRIIAANLSFRPNPNT